MTDALASASGAASGGLGDDPVPEVVHEVAAIEAQLHLADVPKVAPRVTKGGKPRPGSSKAAAVAAYARRRRLGESGDVGSGEPIGEDPGSSAGGGSRGMDRCNVKELRTACARLSLPVSGNRDALVARLEADLAKSGVDTFQV